MEIIPAINCETEACVRKHLEMLQGIPAEWVHFDVSDGRFTPVKTWDEPECFITDYRLQIADLNIEVHLMVEKPAEYIERWARAGVKRIVLHVETMLGRSDPTFGGVGSLAGVQFGLALRPETPVDAVYAYLDKIRFAQFLAVTPGFSGQKFDERILEKIRALRARDKNVIIEVDGGVNDQTALSILRAGANVVVSSSFLWSHPNPREAFLLLRHIS